MVKFLTRPGCHLCDQARSLVSAEAAKAGARVEEIDIDSDSALTRDYGLRVPVVLSPGGEVLAEGEITDRRKLRSALRKTVRG